MTRELAIKVANTLADIEDFELFIEEIDEKLKKTS